MTAGDDAERERLEDVRRVLSRRRRGPDLAERPQGTIRVVTTGSAA